MFITVLAKHLERPRDGARLSPRGGSPKNTYTQIEEWWNELQGGSWLPATPPGTLIEMNWDLVINGKSIPLQMFDYAGETLTDLFNNRARDAEGAARQYFDQVRTVFEGASVLLVLLNLESLIEQGVGRATETKGTLITAMTAFLNKIKADKRDCRVCFVFTSYDRYESLIKQRWGSVQAFLEQEIPPLYYEVADKNPNVRILPVAAVGETEARIEPLTGIATLYPKAGFKTKGFDQLVRWLIQATSDSKVELDESAAELRQDEENNQFLQKMVQAWKEVQHSTQLEPIERFLSAARSSFPHPHRPKLSDLRSHLQPVIEAASDLRSRLVKEATAERLAHVISVAKGVCVVAAVVIGFNVLAWINNEGAKREAERQRLVEKRLEEEKLRVPRPETSSGEKWTWQYTCGLSCQIGLAEHTAVAQVPVTNKGGAGNVAVIFTIGGKSSSQTRFFNRGETAWVNVTLTGLPNHEPTTGFVKCAPAQ